ncbi:RNA polymerase III-inhibiting protein maf1 [Trifolium repens]|nr:RNA polymerase III-inhibiting protein maf1 [Trifolium repens]
MSDPETKPDQESSLAPPSSTVASPPQPNFNASFTLWPPTQRTRDAVINRLIETLSTSSVLSKRYGTMSADESSAAARQIEDEAFSVADAFSSSDNDSLKILEIPSPFPTLDLVERIGGFRGCRVTLSIQFL